MRSLLLGLLAVAAAGNPAVAGTISISISQTARLADGNLVVDVKVANSGDEAALAVTPSLLVGDKKVRGTGTPSLAPNGSHAETLTLPVGTLGEGRWPYRITVDYTDQNQYPFQALLAQPLVVGNPPAAKVAVPAIAATDVAGEGTLSVTVKNLTPEKRTARVNVLIPEGLEASEPARALELDGWKDATFRVPVVNRTALIGSRYPVFVTAEYDDGPVHQAVVAQGTVAVTGANSFLDRNMHRLRYGAIGLIGLWLVLAMLRTLRRKGAAGV
jgi:hypothetical protein